MFWKRKVQVYKPVSNTFWIPIGRENNVGSEYGEKKDKKIIIKKIYRTVHNLRFASVNGNHGATAIVQLRTSIIYGKTYRVYDDNSCYIQCIVNVVVASVTTYTHNVVLPDWLYVAPRSNIRTVVSELYRLG